MGYKMNGGGKYAVEDLVAGPKDPQGNGRQLSNGAVAGYVRTEEGKLAWRIVQGAPADYLAGVRTQKGQKQKHKRISPRAAKIALNKHYRNSKRYKSPRGRKAARTYDMNHSVDADSI